MGNDFAVAYFGVLAALAMIQPLPLTRRALAVGGAAVMAAAVYAIANTTGGLRDWFPLVIIPVAYYLSGVFFVRPSRSVEDWLMSWDHRLLGDPGRAFVTWPAWTLTTLDVLYLGTLLTVPAGLWALWLAGEMQQADRYWTIVMGSLLICYGGTAIIHTRPPRTLEGTHERAERRMQRIASGVVRNFSIGANTIPSGHVAAPLAVGLALLNPLPTIGALFLLLAIFITLACITGRYHYIIDCALGAIVAVAIWIVQR